MFTQLDRRLINVDYLSRPSVTGNCLRLLRVLDPNDSLFSSVSWTGVIRGATGWTTACCPSTYAVAMDCWVLPE
jgi:hypothetical protein